MLFGTGGVSDRPRVGTETLIGSSSVKVVRSMRWMIGSARSATSSTGAAGSRSSTSSSQGSGVVPRETGVRGATSGGSKTSLPSPQV